MTYASCITLERTSSISGAKVSLTVIADRPDILASPEKSFIVREDRKYLYRATASIQGALEIECNREIFQPFPHSPCEGVIDTRSRAGLFYLRIAPANQSTTAKEWLEFKFDIIPTKIDLAAYRSMLDDICRNVVDLVFRLHGTTRVQVNSNRDALDIPGVEQRFFFLEQLLESESFRLALDHITRSPHSRLKRQFAHKQFTGSSTASRAFARAFVRSNNRMALPSTHPLKHLGSIPVRFVSPILTETLDTHENRFVKFVLMQFHHQLMLVLKLSESSKNHASRRTAARGQELATYLDHVLRHTVFEDVGESEMLPLGSPVLQRRAGYREVLESWIKFDTVAMLAWSSADDVFNIGKRDTDRLYEYWLFFQVVHTLSNTLGVENLTPGEFITCDNGRINVRLLAGTNLSIVRVATIGTKKIKVRFSYNRTFPNGGAALSGASWSLVVRPDFTLTLWPETMEEADAAADGKLRHIHFDSKYRVSTVKELLVDVPGSEYDGAANTKGKAKRNDLYVAHAYRDAIHHSVGAFILFPGSIETPLILRKTDALLPSVGAFPIRPSQASEKIGVEALGRFIEEAVQCVAKSLEDRGPALEMTDDRVKKDAPAVLDLG